MAAGLLAPRLLMPSAVPPDAPAELVGLFIQGCMPFVGDAAALRAWATHTGLPAVPDPARGTFLHGAPGQVFDGSTSDGKLALVSSDDGLCSVVTDKAERQAVADALEAGFRQAGLTFRLVIERDDSHVATIHDREYLATRNGRAWRILAAAVKDDGGGEAMLTGAPE
jgi:hypothetical protein